MRQYRADGARVTGTARDAAGLGRLRELGAQALALDVADATGASSLAWPIDGEAFDTVVINAGVYGPRTQGLQAPTAAEFDAVMHVNVLGTMRVLPQLDGALASGAKLAVIDREPLARRPHRRRRRTGRPDDAHRPMAGGGGPACHCRLGWTGPGRSIAVALGFSDATNFRQAFRKWTQRTPAEYRRAVQA